MVCAQKNRATGRSMRTGAGRTARWSLVASVMIAAGLIGGVFAATAQAFHIPGATYTGSAGGGGTVQFAISPDGSTVTNFRVENIQGSSCTFIFAQDPSGTPITNHAFSEGGSLSYSGSFQGVQSAQGTFSITSSSPFGPPCTTGPRSWTATTTASPAGSEECQNAQAAVASAEQAVKKAKKKVKQADDAEEKKKAKKKLRKAKQELAAAQQQQAAVCG